MNVGFYRLFRSALGGGVLVADHFGAICSQKMMAGLYEWVSPDPATAGQDCFELKCMDARP